MNLTFGYTGIGMGGIEIFVCNYILLSKNITIITVIVSTLFLLKTNYKHVKLFLNVCKNFMKSDNYQDIGQLLLHMIIVNT